MHSSSTSASIAPCDSSCHLRGHHHHARLAHSVARLPRLGLLGRLQLALLLLEGALDCAYGAPDGRLVRYDRRLGLARILLPARDLVMEQRDVSREDLLAMLRVRSAHSRLVLHVRRRLLVTLHQPALGFRRLPSLLPRRLLQRGASLRILTLLGGESTCARRLGLLLLQVLEPLRRKQQPTVVLCEALRALL